MVIVAIIAGMRLKRRRVAAERALAERRIAAHPPTAPVIHTTVPTAPSPPPLADEPVVAAAPDSAPAQAYLAAAQALAAHLAGRPRASIPIASSLA